MEDKKHKWDCSQEIYVNFLDEADREELKWNIFSLSKIYKEIWADNKHIMQ